MTAGLVYEEHNPCGQHVQDEYPLWLQKAEATSANQNHTFADTRSRAPLSAVMVVAYALCGSLHLHICPQNRCHTCIREAFRSRAVCAAF